MLKVQLQDKNDKSYKKHPQQQKNIEQIPVAQKHSLLQCILDWIGVVHAEKCANKTGSRRDSWTGLDFNVKEKSKKQEQFQIQCLRKLRSNYCMGYRL